MTWLGDMERKDPAYPGAPGDPDTTSWSRDQSQQLNEMLFCYECAMGYPCPHTHDVDE